MGFFQGGDPGAGVALGISLVECLQSEVPVSVDGVMSVPHTSRRGARRKTWVECQLGFGQGGWLVTESCRAGARKSPGERMKCVGRDQGTPAKESGKEQPLRQMEPRGLKTG